MNEDEILSFDYRSPRRIPKTFAFIEKSNIDGWDEVFKPLNLFKPLKVPNHIPAWCEIGTKFSSKSDKENIFGIIVNVFRGKGQVAIKWDNGKIADYHIDFLTKLVYKGTIEILYE